MRKHQRRNSYDTERASRAAARRAQEVGITYTPAHHFWNEYYRLSSERVTDKTPRFEMATLEEIAYRLAMPEQAVITMMGDMLAEGITHRHPEGEILNSVLSGGVA